MGKENLQQAISLLEDFYFERHRFIPPDHNKAVTTTINVLRERLADLNAMSSRSSEIVHSISDQVAAFMTWR